MNTMSICEVFFDISSMVYRNYMPIPPKLSRRGIHDFVRITDSRMSGGGRDGDRIGGERVGCPFGSRIFMSGGFDATCQNASASREEARGRLCRLPMKGNSRRWKGERSG